MSTTDAIAVHGRFTIFCNCIVYKHEERSLVIPAPILFFSATQVMRFFNFYNLRGSFSAKRFYHELGLTPTQFMIYSNNLMRQYFPVPYDLFALMYRGKKVPLQAIWYHRYKENVEVYDQIIQDRLYNLIPIVLVFGKTPHELKKFFGKGLWKVLSNNSKSKNKLIMEVYTKIASSNSFDASNRYTVLTVLALSRLSSTVLALLNRGSFTRLPAQFLDWAVNSRHFVTQKEMSLWLMRYYTLVLDTMNMCNQEHKKFNVRWSPNRVKEIHDALSKQITLRRYSDEKIMWLADLPTQIHVGDWTLNLLFTPRLVAEEAMAMQHCVASYIGAIQRRSYIVFSLSYKGGAHATIGCRNHNNIWTLDQVKGYKNAFVSIPSEITDTILKCLN